MEFEKYAYEGQDLSGEKGQDLEVLKYHWMMLIEAWKSAMSKENEEHIIKNDIIIKCLDKIPAEMLA